MGGGSMTLLCLSVSTTHCADGSPSHLLLPLMKRSAAIAPLVSVCWVAALLGCVACARSSHDDDVSRKPVGSVPSVPPQTDRDALRSWSGSYQYPHTAGHTAAGTTVVVRYDLTMAKSDPGRATLRIAGYQTNQTLECDV